MFTEVKDSLEGYAKSYDKNDIRQQQRSAQQVKYRYDQAVRALSAAGAAPARTDTSKSVTELAAQGLPLRIPAGGSATLSITDVAGWHYDSAVLTLTTYGANVALPLPLTGSSPGPSNFAAVQTFLPKQPVFVASLIYGYVGLQLIGASVNSKDKLVLEVDGVKTDPAWSLTLTSNGKRQSYATKHVGGHLAKLTLLQSVAHAVEPWITAILPNVAEGLVVAQDDDRVLHSVPRALPVNEAAQTSDLSSYFNASAEAGSAPAILRISARTDCCVSVKLSYRRRRLAEGVSGDALPETVALSPFEPAVLAPSLPLGDSVQTTVSARATAIGPALLGVGPTAAPATWQTVALPPRTALMQPFTLPQTAAPAPLRLTGIWLGLTEPPADAETLHVDICRFDADSRAPGPALITEKIEISAREMDLTRLETVPDAPVFLHWAEFETPLEIDTADLAEPLALVLRDQSGPIPLIEVPAPVSGPLMPALWRNLARSDRWQARRFGAAEKVLLFELGIDRDHATLSIDNGSDSQSLTFTKPRSELQFVLPGRSSLNLTCDRSVTLSDIQIVSSSIPEIG